MKFELRRKSVFVIIAIIAVILAVVLAIIFSVEDEEKEPEVPAPEPSATVVEITPTKPYATNLIQYNNGDFSMKIPEGWQVEVVQGKNYGIRVYDPDDERYQIMYYYSLGGFLKNKEAKQYYQVYSGISSTGFEKLPVLNPGTVESLFKTWTTIVGYAKTNIDGYANFNFPFFFNFKVKEQFELGSDLKNALGTKVTEGIVKAEYTDDTGANKAEGMFSTMIVDMDSSDSKMPYAVYNTIGITTEATELANWKEVLFECLSSIKFSDKYIESVKTHADEETVIDLNTEIQNAVNAYEAAWKSRQLAEEKKTQIAKDESEGKERVYDVNTGKVYLADKGWYKNYVGDTYMLAEEDRYAEPVVGVIK